MIFKIGGWFLRRLYGFGNVWIFSGMDGWPCKRVYGFGGSWVMLVMGGQLGKWFGDGW